MTQTSFKREDSTAGAFHHLNATARQGQSTDTSYMKLISQSTHGCFDNIIIALGTFKRNVACLPRLPDATCRETWSTCGIAVSAKKAQLPLPPILARRPLPERWNTSDIPAGSGLYPSVARDVDQHPLMCNITARSPCLRIHHSERVTEQGVCPDKVGISGGYSYGTWSTARDLALIIHQLLEVSRQL